VMQRKQSIELVKATDNLLTLENYCERYIPIVIMNRCRELLQSVFTDDMLLRFIKSSQKQMIEI